MKRFYLITCLIAAMLIFVACTIEPTQTPSPLVTTEPTTTAPITTSTILQGLLNFCMNASLPLILGMCALDVAFGIGAALRTNKFDWKRVGNFYKTQVLSLIVPYVVTLAVLTLVPGITEWLPVAVAPGTMLAGILATVGGSLLANVEVLRKPMEEQS